MIKRTRQNNIVIITLVSLFAIYNVIVYTQKTASPVSKMSNSALAGQKLWQENNCTSCHQLYGLGGYLGPDLTNVISTPGKGIPYVKAFLNSGVKSMPEFDFSELEKEQISMFLAHVDSTGYYPNYDAQFNKDGWVTIDYK